MALTLQQFRKSLRADRELIRNGGAPVGLTKCANSKCNVPLQESITGNRPVRVGKVLKHFCSDCYYEKFGPELDDYPIYTPRVHRG